MNKICRLSGILFLAMAVSVSSVSAKINIFAKPRYIPAISFYGDSGKAYGLTDFNTDLLMAVVWSRHCVPCLKDLKPLRIFADKVADEGIKVILISPESDWKTGDERRNFLKKFKAEKLVNYSDRKSKFKDGMGIMVTPTVILVNKDGLEVGQITGTTEWDDPEVISYMIKLKNGLYSE